MTKVEHTNKEVIEDRLLVELTEKGQVAIVVDRFELLKLIDVVDYYLDDEDANSLDGYDELCDLKAGMEKLNELAFQNG